MHVAWPSALRPSAPLLTRARLARLAPHRLIQYLAPAQVWPEATAMTIAAVLAYLLAQSVFHMHGADWAVIASFMTSRGIGGGSKAETAKAVLERLGGMLLGMAVGIAAASGRQWHIPEAVLIAAATLPLGIVVARFRRFQTAPMLAIIVLSTGASFGGTVHMAERRLAEIALGATVGIAVAAAAAFLMARYRGSRAARQHAAHALDDLASLIALLTAQHRGVLRQAGRLRERIRAELRLSVAADKTFAARRTGAGDRLSMALPRLVADVTLIGRALAGRSIDPDHPAWPQLDDVVQRFANACTVLARHLDDNTAPPSLFDLDAALEALRTDLTQDAMHCNDEGVMALPFLLGRLFADLSDIVPAL
jgi:uncharacterized membrane protein YccC